MITFYYQVLSFISCCWNYLFSLRSVRLEPEVQSLELIGLVKDINPDSLSWIHISETEGLCFQGSLNLQNLKENLVLVYCGLKEKFSKVQYIIHFIFQSYHQTNQWSKRTLGTEIRPSYICYKLFSSFHMCTPCLYLPFFIYDWHTFTLRPTCLSKA